MEKGLLTVRSSTRKVTSARLPSSLSAFLAILLAAAFVSPAGAAEPGMFRYESTHYTVETDTSPRFAEVVGRHMEAILRRYASQFGGYDRITEHFDVAVFRSEGGYLAQVPDTVRGSTGVFVSSQRLLAAHCQNRTPEEVLRTLYHEGFHEFMYYVVSQQCPMWLNEGLAEYFSEATWDGKEFATGQVPTMRLFTVQQALKNGTYIRLSDLFSMGAEQWLQNVRADARRASLHYSESWSVVQFLFHADGGRYAPMLHQFVQDIALGMTQEQAFQHCFNTDMHKFEAAWARYVMSLQPSPKFCCRDNMESALLLAKMAYGDPRKLEDLASLRTQVLYAPGVRWQITRPNGEKVSSDRGEQVAALFRCPFDEGGGRISYLLLKDQQTGRPVLICDHHPGFIIKAYFAYSDPGDLRPVVEEEVRETVTDDLRQAIVNAARSGAYQR